MGPAGERTGPDRGEQVGGQTRVPPPPQGGGGTGDMLEQEEENEREEEEEILWDKKRRIKERERRGERYNAVKQI